MKTECRFIPIDVETWPRRETFRYFSQMAPTRYSLTARMDVNKTRRILKEKGMKFASL